MLVQRTGQWAECITPRQTFYERSEGSTSIYRANRPLCKRQSRDKQYWGNYDNYRGPGNIARLPVSLTKTKSGLRMCLRRSMCIKNINESDVIEAETFTYSESDFQQLIEYSGKNDEVLTFTHSEFVVDSASDAFTREFTFDLSAGNVLDYRGAIIEVIEATNMNIRYKVVRNFQE